jgi:hypothetical protein
MLNINGFYECTLLTEVIFRSDSHVKEVSGFRRCVAFLELNFHSLGLAFHNVSVWRTSDCRVTFSNCDFICSDPIRFVIREMPGDTSHCIHPWMSEYPKLADHTSHTVHMLTTQHVRIPLSLVRHRAHLQRLAGRVPAKTRRETL